jgi:hypothetical protein
VDLIFEGRITGHQHLKDALTRIQEIAIPGTSILRVSAPELDHSGRLLIKDSRLVVAALTRDSLYEGYDGVRQILSTTIGHYAFLQVGPMDHVDLIPNLNIPVDAILKAMPDLPLEPGVLFDEKSLLDKVFTTTSGAGPVTPSQASAGDEIADVLSGGAENLDSAGRRWNVSDSVIFADDSNDSKAGEEPSIFQSQGSLPSQNSAQSQNSLESQNSLKSQARMRDIEKPKPTSQEFAGLDASELKASAAKEREGRYVRRSQKPASRVSPMIVCSLLLISFCAQAGAVIYWPKVAAYLKHASSQVLIGVDSTSHVPHKIR